MRSKKIIAPALLVVLIGTLLVQLPLAIAERSSVYEWFNPIIDVRDVLVRRYVIEPDLEKMQQLMIQGMIDALEDPHTTYIPPSRRAEFERQMHGTYVGIGAEVNIVDGYLTIISPMEGSPALEAGVLAGDTVLEIDGESTLNRPIQESIDRLLGKPGTTVTIRVRHVDGQEQELTVTRRRIVTNTIRGLVRDGERWVHCLDEQLGLAYVRINQFTMSTREDLLSVLDELQNHKLNGLVLDLRDNPGGSLAAAVQVADLFLESGVIVSVRDRNGEGDTFRARAQGTLPEFPMIILVNSGSASASEIVAGALQEAGRAKVLGTRTFGKGSVQEVRELPFDQGTLKYTAAHYHLASGRNLNRLPDSEVWGVDPDPGFVLPIEDNAYRDMVLARREFEIIREADDDIPSCIDAQWTREHLLDDQLAAAIEALSSRVRGEPWPQPGGDSDPGLVAFNQELRRAADERARLLERLGTLEKRIGELQDLSVTAGGEPLLPDDVDLQSGTITLRDRYGNVVGEYRIDAGDMNLALQSLRLTRIEEE